MLRLPSNTRADYTNVVEAIAALTDKVDQVVKEDQNIKVSSMRSDEVFYGQEAIRLKLHTAE